MATTRGDLLRSWAADVANVMHPRYTWHDFAQIWQTEGAGEEFFASQAGVPAADLAAGYEAMGVPAGDTGVLVPLGDPVMASCIMDLYRSATPRIFDAWGDALAPTSAPGLVLHATDDSFGDESLSGEVADLLGARRATLSGVGHWWALQDPDAAADVLDAFHTVRSAPTDPDPARRGPAGRPLPRSGGPGPCLPVDQWDDVRAEGGDLVAQLLGRAGREPHLDLADARLG